MRQIRNISATDREDVSRNCDKLGTSAATNREVPRFLVVFLDENSLFRAFQCFTYVFPLYKVIFLSRRERFNYRYLQTSATK